MSISMLIKNLDKFNRSSQDIEWKQKVMTDELKGDTAPENFGIYSVIEHDRVDFFTSKGQIRVVMYMPCVKCSCSELKLAKHLHTFFVLTLN